MRLNDEVFGQASRLAGPLAEPETELLRVLCGAAAAALTARLREDVSREDCHGPLTAAASLLALADFQEGTGAEFKAGDFHYAGTAGGTCLRQRAMGLMAPYLADGFSFQGV